MAVPTWAPTRPEDMGLRLMLANITALRPRIHGVLAVDADVLALVETCATEAGQRILGATAARAGWVPHWGAPLLPRVSGSPWDTAPGGVAVFVMKEVPARTTRIPNNEEAPTRQLRQTGRWLHVSLGTRNGKGILELSLCYGMQGRGRESAALLDAVTEHAVLLGNLPKALLGHFNEDLSTVGRLPSALRDAIKSGALIDVDKAYAEATGGRCRCIYRTCGGGSTRIAGLLADKYTAAAVTGVKGVEGLDLPGHSPTLFQFALGSMSQRVRKARKVRTAPRETGGRQGQGPRTIHGPHRRGREQGLPLRQGMSRPPSCESSDQEQRRDAGLQLGDGDLEDCKEGDLLER